MDAESEDVGGWLSTETVSILLQSIPARRIMVVADACYAGTESVDAGPEPLGVQASNASTPQETRVRTVLVSGGLSPVVGDADSGNSVFAAALLEALRANEGVLDGSDLHRSIVEPLRLGADQTPEYGGVPPAGHESGDYRFARSAPETGTPAAGPAPPTGEVPPPVGAPGTEP